MEENFTNVHRRVVVFFSTLFGIVTSCTNGTAADASATLPEHLTLMEFFQLCISMLLSQETARVAVGAAVGGFIGFIYYIITSIYKRWYFTKYPIPHKEIQKDIKND